MRAFTFERASTPPEAAAAALRTRGAKFIAGGTNLLDLMKLEIETPQHLIDVNGLGLDKVEPKPDGGLRIGALVPTMCEKDGTVGDGRSVVVRVSCWCCC